MTASWYLQDGVYVGMSALRGIRVERDDGETWWWIDRRDESRKARASTPYRSAEEARDAAARRVSA